MTAGISSSGGHLPSSILRMVLVRQRLQMLRFDNLWILYKLSICYELTNIPLSPTTSFQQLKTFRKCHQNTWLEPMMTLGTAQTYAQCHFHHRAHKLLLCCFDRPTQASRPSICLIPVLTVSSTRHYFEQDQPGVIFPRTAESNVNRALPQRLMIAVLFCVSWRSDEYTVGVTDRSWAICVASLRPIWMRATPIRFSSGLAMDEPQTYRLSSIGHDFWIEE